MRTLFLEIFLSFWLAMVLGGIGLVVATALTQPETFSEYMTGEGSREDAAKALAIYEREGSAGLERYLETFARERGLRLFVLDEKGEEVTSREVPRFIRRIASRESADDDEVVFNRGAPRIAVRSVEAPSGARYRVVFWSSRERETWLALSPETLALRGLAVLVTSAVVCYVLARSLTAPIRKVRLATRELANGDLRARVGPELGSRRDELAELGRDFDAMAARIEALVTAQQRLLGDISHELRSPLARLGVALDLARRRGERDIGDLLGRMELESERLDELIGELLELNRLESGAEVADEPIDLAALVEEIAADADFEAQADDRSVRVVSADACEVAGDRNLLRRAIENVARNAVRYTPEETTVEIALSCDEREAIVRVRDFGPGVPDEELPNLFRPFYRVAGARERDTGGAGLGLAITERAVAIHGGSVAASNAPGGGLTVEIRLPRMHSQG